MATRVIPPRILKKFRYNTVTKPLNAVHPSLTPAIAPPAFFEKPPSVAAEVALGMDDAERLFASVSTGRLLRSASVLHATAVGPMVDLGMWFMKSPLLQSGLPRDLVMSVTRETFFSHFCAGEDAAGASKSIGVLNDAGLRSMLVYGVEDAHDNEGCDQNLNGFLHTVTVSKSLPPSSVSASSFSLVFRFLLSHAHRRKPLIVGEVGPTSIQCLFFLSYKLVIFN